MFRTWILAVAACVLCTTVLAKNPIPKVVDNTASSPAATSAPAKLPPEVIKELEGSMLQIMRSTSLEDRADNMAKFIKAGEEIEAKYPDATDLYRVQLPMLQVASALGRQQKDPAFMTKSHEIAQRVLQSSAPLKEKAQADLALTADKLMPLDTASQPSDEQATKEIRALVEKYSKTEAAGTATAFGLRLAQMVKNQPLQDEYAKALETKYLKEEGVKALLRQIGRHPDVGVVFEAELTKLDGTKVSLPKDLKGKIYVVDFWASWCPPCRAISPNMKKTYDKYKDKGVEFVGISLDKADGKDAAEAFIKENDLNWIQTYSGKFWDDPTIKKYGIAGIPSVWIIGKDGKVIMDGVTGDSLEDIHANVEKLIEQALGSNSTATAASDKADSSK